MMGDKKIIAAVDVAETDFERFCKYWDIDVPDELNDKSNKQEKLIMASFLLIKSRMCKYISEGILVVSEDGSSVTQHCKYPPIGTDNTQPYKLTYAIRSLGDLFDIDKADGKFSENVAIIAALTGKSRAQISQVDFRDLRYSDPIKQLFFSLLA